MAEQMKQIEEVLKSKDGQINEYIEKIKNYEQQISELTEINSKVP